MTITVSDVMTAMESLAPAALAEKWDNPGLQVGHPLWRVDRIQVALDPTPEVVKAAINQEVDMLVTHHPLIFSPIKNLDLSTPMGHLLELAFSHQLAIFSAHTNLDVVQDGVNDTLARVLGLSDVVWLDGLPGDVGQLSTRQPFGFGRMGALAHEMSLKELAVWVKTKLNLPTVKTAGLPDLKISRVAACGGSGSSLMKAFFASGAQVFVSGDLKYHDARDAEALNLGLVDIGHFGSEQLVLDILAKELDKQLAKKDFGGIVDISEIEKDPFIYY